MQITRLYSISSRDHVTDHPVVGYELRVFAVQPVRYLVGLMYWWLATKIVRLLGRDPRTWQIRLLDRAQLFDARQEIARITLKPEIAEQFFPKYTQPYLNHWTISAKTRNVQKR